MYIVLLTPTVIVCAIGNLFVYSLGRRYNSFLLTGSTSVEEIGLYYGFASCTSRLGDDGSRDVTRDRILIEAVKDC